LSPEPDDLLAPLVACARVEAATARELADVQRTLADWDGASSDIRATWEAREVQLQQRLSDEQDATLAFARGLVPEEEWEAQRLVLRARALVPRRRERAAPTSSSRLALCPVQGCGTTVQDGTRTTCEPRELPIDAPRADQPYTCPCPRRALLSVGQTRHGWVLREYVSDRDAREEINLIVHALVAGQTADRERPHQRTDTAPDPTGERMARAFMVSHRLALEAVRWLLQGHPQAALEAAEKAKAADTAYRIHHLTFQRQRREVVRAGRRWKDASCFYVDLPVTLKTRVGAPATGENGKAVSPVHHRTTFEFIAVWDEQGRDFVVANAEEIERQSGIEVGADGWRQLIALLTRMESKPGVSTDALVFRPNHEGTTLTLRPQIRDRYSRALVALEALRQTLVLDAQKRSPQEAEDWLYGEPDWVQDFLGREAEMVEDTAYVLLRQLRG